MLRMTLRLFIALGNIFVVEFKMVRKNFEGVDKNNFKLSLLPLWQENENKF